MTNSGDPMRPSIKKWQLLFAIVLTGAALILSFGAGKAEPASISVEEAWARPGAEGAISGGYLVIRNSGGPDRLIAIATDRATTTEIHTTGSDDGMMTMRRLELLNIPESATVTFEPGGNHLMFIGLTTALNPGDKVAAILTFEKAGPIAVEFDVNMMGPAASGTHEHMRH